jgi:alcohol dehydrogenase (cytochrome c)
MLLLVLFATAFASSVLVTGESGGNAIPPEVLQNAKDWPLPNKDYSNTRATENCTINSTNVMNLKIAWSVPINASGLFGSASSNPLILGDTIYFQDLSSNLFSLKMDSGEINWKRIYNLSTIGPNGPAVGWGKLFAAKGVYNITALDINTGKELWIRNISTGKTVGIDIQPIAYGDLVFTSTVPGSSATDFYAGGGVGVIYALDQENGSERWSFSTVDSADIWGNKTVNSGGGCWYSPSVDLKTGLLFWGVGNPAPWPGTAEYPSGSSRPGPNLYTDSILALDSSSGKLRWYSQVNSHDILDHDFQIPPILTEANVGGKHQEIVLGAGKLGRVIAFNRSTGAILWTALVGKHENDQLLSIPNETTRVYPGYLGGVETPMAYAEGVVYVPYIDLYVNYTGQGIVDVQKFDQGKGGLAAIDVETGKILWDKLFDSMNFGGATVINDLVFTATFDGTIYALDRRAGSVAWQFKAPAGINAWPAVSEGSIIWPCAASGEPSLIALRLP